MKIPIINRFRPSENFPAEAWIVKPYKNDIDLEKDRARRVDEKNDKTDVVSKETRFELKKGGTTQPVPYKQIYDTNQGPLVILLSPEKGTYIPADFSLQDFTSILEDPKDKLEEIKKQLPEKYQEGLQEKEEEIEEHIEDLEDFTPLQAQLDVALDNQEWLRWGKNTVMDLKLSWEEDEGFWDRHGSAVILAISAMLLVVIGIINYMAMKDISKAIESSSSIIPVGLTGLKAWKRR